MRHILIIIIPLLLIACKDKKPLATAVSIGRARTSDTYYTCSMHPQVMQETPGKCPICGMELIPVKKVQAQAHEDLVLSDQQVLLGNIQVDTIGNAAMGSNMVLTATLDVNETRNTSVNARIAGRIEKLYHKNTGEYLHKGEKLYDLYSEELNTAKQEYILALEREKTLNNPLIDFKQLLEAARNKLRLWGMNEQQIEELARTKQSPLLTTFYSPYEGYITELPGHEGDYVTEGTVLIRLADISVLWAEAQVYASRLSQLDRNAIAVVRVPDLPGKEWTGRIAFVNPEINPATRIDLIRVEVPNRNGSLKPGMPAYVTLTSRRAHTITLPVEAVIRGENANTVWVRTGHNIFRPAMVEIGHEDGNRLEITSGLKEGDIVVTGGTYLLNSEYVFKHGSDPMAGMDMKKM